MHFVQKSPLQGDFWYPDYGVRVTPLFQNLTIHQVAGGCLLLLQRYCNIRTLANNSTIKKKYV